MQKLHLDMKIDDNSEQRKSKFIHYNSCIIIFIFFVICLLLLATNVAISMFIALNYFFPVKIIITVITYVFISILFLNHHLFSYLTSSCTNIHHLILLLYGNKYKINVYETTNNYKIRFTHKRFISKCYHYH